MKFHSWLISACLLCLLPVQSTWINKVLLEKKQLINTIRDHSDQIKALSKKYIKEVTVTAYTPRKSECDSDPLIAASMKKVRLGTIAVSRDLFNEGWVFGRKVYIEGQGIFEINDLMNPRHRARIDIFMWEFKKAKKFGKKKAKASLLFG